jgi:Kef-type K+ transport system membrane component KefB
VYWDDPDGGRFAPIRTFNMPDHTAVSIPLAMLILFASAKIMGEIAERLHQPGIVGEIVAGVLVGPSVLGWISPSEFFIAMSDLGAMFLLFRVGLEVKSSELLKVGGTALLVAVLGVLIPFAAGAAIMLYWHDAPNESIFVGASMVATSVGITAQVLAAKGLLNEVSSKVILAAAVIDDVLGLLVLAVVSSVTRGRVDILQLALTAVLAAAFTFIVARWGPRAVGKVLPKVHENLRASEARFAVSICLLLALAAAAAFAGVAAIVGAFLAGLALAETSGPRERDLTQGVSEFVVPFFMAGIGLRVDLSTFRDVPTVLLATAIFAAAFLSKFLGCGLGALGLGRTEALRIGIGMVPRGEVGMIVAQIGLGLGVVTGNIYAVIVFMSVATTVVAPPLIKLAYAPLLRRRAGDISLDLSAENPET